MSFAPLSHLILLQFYHLSQRFTISLHRFSLPDSESFSEILSKSLETPVDIFLILHLFTKIDQIESRNNDIISTKSYVRSIYIILIIRNLTLPITMIRIKKREKTLSSRDCDRCVAIADTSYLAIRSTLTR